MRIPTPPSRRFREAVLAIGITLIGVAMFAERRGLASDEPDEQSATSEYLIIPAAKKSELTRTARQWSFGSERNWVRSHGDTASSRFSRLTQIDKTNVAKLQVAWEYRSNDGVGNIQCNPIIIDGVMYAPTSGHRIVAVDAASGREIWSFRPGGRPAHRGLMYWEKGRGEDRRLFFPSGEHLWAVDPATGLPVKSFGDGGRVAAESVTAPVVHRDSVIVATTNQVKAFQAITGKPVWSFRIIPEEADPYRDTWIHRRRAGKFQGANVWGGITLDDARGIVYVATGSPHPNFIGVNHRGRNLFANSVIALDARSGKYLWHFQEIRHDIWDLDIPAAPNLVTIVRNGIRVDAVAQVTKLGNTLLLDRVTGKPIFPFRLRKAPPSDLEEEQAWPYQPDVELPQPFSRQSFTSQEVTNLSPASRASVLKQLTGANMGWFQPFSLNKPTAFFGVHGGAEWTGAAFDPSSGWLYVSANEIPFIITVSRRKTSTLRDASSPATNGQKIYRQRCAACHGSRKEGKGTAPPLDSLAGRVDDAVVIDVVVKGRNLMPPTPGLSETEKHSLVDFLFDRDLPSAAKTQEAEPEYTHNGYPKLLDDEGYPGARPPWGTLNAIDLNTGKLAWQSPLGEYAELTRRGISKTGTENFGGASVTAGGLVFCAGTRDNKIRAFDARTGAELWEHTLPFGGYAPPSIYQAAGRQFVVIAATGGGKLGGKTGDAYVAFALPKTTKKVRE